MNISTFTLLLGFAAATVAEAAAPKSKSLTPERLAVLTADAPKYKTCTVTIGGLTTTPASAETGIGFPQPQKRERTSPSSIRFKPNGRPNILELIREFRFPTDFDAAKPSAKDSLVTPTTPTFFESVNAGWTIKLSARQQGKLLAVSGVADYVEVEMLPGGYGTAAAPIYSEQGRLISPNKITQPKSQTTTSRFFLFAGPGETCEVTLFHGNKAKKHPITITVD
jgi:hypothetical protein